jgi:hypothetical protein
MTTQLALATVLSVRSEDTIGLRPNSLVVIRSCPFVQQMLSMFQAVGVLPLMPLHQRGLLD